MNFNKVLETLIFQRSYIFILNIHSIDRLSKAGAALVNTISSVMLRLNANIAGDFIMFSFFFHLLSRQDSEEAPWYSPCVFLSGI